MEGHTIVIPWRTGSIGTFTSQVFDSSRLTEVLFRGPNDEKANSLLDVFHHSMTLMLDGELYTAPIDGDKCENVLDIGTGTGRFATTL